MEKFAWMDDDELDLLPELDEARTGIPLSTADYNDLVVTLSKTRMRPPTAMRSLLTKACVAGIRAARNKAGAPPMTRAEERAATKEAKAWANDVSKVLIEQMDRTTYKQVISAIRGATIGNTTDVDKARRSIIQLFNRYVKGGKKVGAATRIQQVAYNELGTAFYRGMNNEFGRMAQNGEVKDVLVKRWYVVGDERTCPICMGNFADGWVPVNESFSSWDMAPPAHIGCRCHYDVRPMTGVDVQS